MWSNQFVNPIVVRGAAVLWWSVMEGDELHAAAGEAGAGTPSSRKQLELLVLLLFILRGASHTTSDHEALGCVGAVMTVCMWMWKKGM